MKKYWILYHWNTTLCKIERWIFCFLPRFLPIIFMCAYRKQSVKFQNWQDMNYFLLAETEFFRRINEAGDYLVISSRFSHPINSAILANVCRSGWCILVHHLLTVTGETPSCSASHLLVFWFSTRTTLSLLRGLSFIFIKLKSSANIIKDCDITKFISNYLSTFQFGEPL